MSRDATGDDEMVLLSSRGVAKVTLWTARDAPKGEERARARSRELLALWCGVRNYDAVEMLAATLGDDHVIDTVVAFIETHGIRDTPPNR